MDKIRLNNITKIKIDNSPVPILWKTNSKGNIYVYEKFWKDLLKELETSKKTRISQSDISKATKINRRTLRDWLNKKREPRMYKKEEFLFTDSNLYFLGLFYSDGHMRNNGGNYSYTYQTESSNIFQGYWYPQLLQKLSIFQHKEKRNITILRNCNNRSWTFRTNLSGISPIFLELLKAKRIINKKNKTQNSGYNKKLPDSFLNSINKESLFQGIIDGDGSIKTYNNSFMIDLALDPKSNYHNLIKNFSLVPTLAVTKERKGERYSKKLNELYSIRLAPSSINKIDYKYSAQDVVNQLKFMLDSAQYSIRPDKVHELIKIINIMCSKKYGEYNNSIPIQREIRDLANKKQLKEKAEELKKQYLIKNNKYLPFRPLWAREIFSKKEWFSEAWYPFINKEHLNIKNYPNKEKLNFEGGIPIDFKL